jgi:cathepsin X
MLSTVIVSLSYATEGQRRSELLSRAEVEALGIVWGGNSSTVSSHDLLTEEATYPDDFTWGNKDGVNYLTPSLNQHIPQYCGSCWSHGSVSALADRIKIARGAKGIDIQLSVQHMLNCGNVGSCHGGSLDGPYQWIHKLSQTGTGISYLTSQPYMACSSESETGICKGQDWTCTPKNVAVTCATFGVECVGLDHYPNATIAEYGHISGAKAMQKEIYARGPIACTIDAAPIIKYTGGIATDKSFMTDHVISVVGWGTDDTEGLYWIVRNSWGEYWGEQGYVRVKSGALALEQACAWATPKDYTAPEKGNQYHCYEDGSNCESTVEAYPA